MMVASTRILAAHRLQQRRRFVHIYALAMLLEDSIHGQVVKVDVKVGAPTKMLRKRHGARLCAGDAHEELGRARDRFSEGTTERGQYIAFGMCACSSCSADCVEHCQDSMPPLALCLQCAACATQTSGCQADQQSVPGPNDKPLHITIARIHGSRLGEQGPKLIQYNGLQYHRSPRRSLNRVGDFNSRPAGQRGIGWI